jgi:hypothetical protein
MSYTTLKKFVPLAALFFGGIAAMAQDLPGIRTSNYSGVNGVFSNPASIADSRYRWDVNLLSVNVQAGSEKAAFKFSNISKSFDGDSAINAQLFGKENGVANGIMALSAHLPSVMFNAGHKLSFALSARTRLVTNFNDVDGKLVKKVIDTDINDPSLPYTLNSGANSRLNATAWTDFGATVAREIFDHGKHFLKGGLTLKYLAGTGNAYININKIQGRIDVDLAQQDLYLNNTTGHIGMAFSGVKTDDFSISDLTKFNASGFGADLGLVYEYRPDYDTYHDNPERWNSTISKYLLRVGVSLMDLGRLRFSPDAQRSGAYDIGITGLERYYLKNNFEDLSLDNYNAKFKSQPSFFTPTPAESPDGKYSVSLPTTLQVDVDYHAYKGWYVNLASQLALSSNKNKPYNSAYYNSFTLTPRMEGNSMGVYVPLSYNELTKFNAGLGMRLGPVFFGSGSILNMLFGSSKQIDAHFGIRFGGLKKKPKKVVAPAVPVTPAEPASAATPVPATGA